MASTLEASAGQLRAVSARAVAEYERRLDALLFEVGRDMATYPAILSLVGHGPMTEMFEFNRLHSGLMRAVLRFGDFLLLLRGHGWFVRAYQARGFWRNFFPVAMRSWAKAALAQMDPATGAEIARLYGFLTEHHGAFAEPDRAAAGVAAPREGAGISDTFLDGLLAGDEASCLAIARGAVAPGGLNGLYEGVVRPAMQRLGARWETGAVDGAAERIATGIVERVIHVAASGLGPRDRVDGLTAVVACAPDERHTIGARMVADLLRLDGWDAIYLGSDVPAAEVPKLLLGRGSTLLAVSVTLPAHLVGVSGMVAAVRAVPALGHVRIIVGGSAIESVSDTTMRALGVDGWARDAVGAARLATKWRMPVGERSSPHVPTRLRPGSRLA